MFYKLLLTGVLLASLGFAQRGGGGRGGGGGDMGGGMPMAMPTKFDNLCNALNLTKDQKKAVKTMLDEGNKEAASLRDQLAKSRLVMADGIQANKGQEDLDQAEKAYAGLSTQMTLLEMKAFAKIVNSLDGNQKANRNGLAMVFSMMNGMFRNKNWNED